MYRTSARRGLRYDKVSGSLDVGLKGGVRGVVSTRPLPSLPPPISTSHDAFRPHRLTQVTEVHKKPPPIGRLQFMEQSGLSRLGSAELPRGKVGCTGKWSRMKETFGIPKTDLPSEKMWKDRMDGIARSEEASSRKLQRPYTSADPRLFGFDPYVTSSRQLHDEAAFREDPFYRDAMSYVRRDAQSRGRNKCVGNAKANEPTLRHLEAFGKKKDFFVKVKEHAYIPRSSPVRHRGFSTTYQDTATVPFRSKISDPFRSR
eukprot:TRINITY_DN2484_c0_g1_i1.p1 TRINITY_DN2484_c0_g1~~TRINITY_DN2484_c0_g1_i1.p1  ORF type:complete len:302 (-),score=69.19 TRINITY_DN2484_c0_g1_i1:111-887(-)